MKSFTKKIKVVLSLLLIINVFLGPMITYAEEIKQNNEPVVHKNLEKKQQKLSDQIIDEKYQIKDVNFEAIVTTEELSVSKTLDRNKEHLTKDFFNEKVNVIQEAMVETYEYYYITLNSQEIGWISAEAVEKTEDRPEEIMSSVVYESKNERNIPNITYSSFIEGKGWEEPKQLEEKSGTVGKNLAIQGIILNINDFDNLNIEYSTHVQSYGWTNSVSNGELSGYPDKNKHVEAITINLTGKEASNYDIYYRVHSQSYGWLGWAKNGEAAGTEGFGKQAEAYEIIVMKKGEAHPNIDSNQSSFIKAEVISEDPIEEVKIPTLKYSTHIQQIGWLPSVNNQEISGTIGQGKRLEALRIDVEDIDELNLTYSTKPRNKEWTKESSNYGISGTVGDSRPLEAVKVNLNGKNSNLYDIYYRVHVQTYGWLDWAKNGENAGTIDLDKQIEAIDIEIVEKNSTPPGKTENPFMEKINISYRTNIEGNGWQNPVEAGNLSGTIGTSKEMYGLSINIANSNLNVEYSTHVQSQGWLEWVSDNRTSGSRDLSKRVEAIKIKLKGLEAFKYDIYYRVHAENFGWLDWAKNGEPAGTEGYGFRAEAVEIKVVPKNSKELNNKNAFKLFTEPNVTYSSHIQKDGWTNKVINGQRSGTTGQSKRMEAIKISLEKQPFDGSIIYKTHVSRNGWTNQTLNGGISGTVGKALPLEAISINLTDDMAKYYDIYYRVHSQSKGWLGWAKNGMNAGTQGMGKQVEAVEVKLFEKGTGPKVIEDEAYIETYLIYLDPGHGGIPGKGGDSGAVYNGVKEVDLNLNISLQVRDKLEQLGYAVVMSREDNNNSYKAGWRDDLYARAAHANAIEADILVSVHHNASGYWDSAANGIETYIYEVSSSHPPLNDNIGSHNNPIRLNESRKLANNIHKQLISNTGARDLGVKSASFLIVREAKMPAVLLELGFMSNRAELNKITSYSYQQKLINGIVSGIHNYFN